MILNTRLNGQWGADKPYKPCPPLNEGFWRFCITNLGNLYIVTATPETVSPTAVQHVCSMPITTSIEQITILSFVNTQNVMKIGDVRLRNIGSADWIRPKSMMMNDALFIEEREIIPAGPTSFPSQVFFVGSNKHYIGCDASGKVFVDRHIPQIWETFSLAILSSSDNIAAFKTRNGKYLSVGSDGYVTGNANTITPFETFKITFNSDNSVSLKTFAGKYLSLDVKNFCLISSNSATPTAAEYFNMINATSKQKVIVDRKATSITHRYFLTEVGLNKRLEFPINPKAGFRVEFIMQYVGKLDDMVLSANLQKDPYDFNNVLLHWATRGPTFGNTVILNSRTNGGWGIEKTNNPCPPLQDCGYWRFSITTENGIYVITATPDSPTVTGVQHICSLPITTPIEQITRLSFIHDRGMLGVGDVRFRNADSVDWIRPKIAEVLDHTTNQKLAETRYV